MAYRKRKNFSSLSMNGKKRIGDKAPSRKRRKDIEKFVLKFRNTNKLLSSKEGWQYHNADVTVTCIGSN